MATTINTDFDSIYLTAHLPEELSIETDAAQLEVNIYVNSVKVFTAVYYPFNDFITVRDIRSVIEAFMYERQLVMATLKIEVFEPSHPITPTTVTIDENGNYVVTYGSDGTAEPDADVTNVKLIYSRLKSSIGSANFLSRSFLTTRKSALVPRNGQVRLNNYTQAYAQGTNFARIYYSPVGSPEQVMTYDLTMSSMQSQTTQIVTATLSNTYYYGIIYSTRGIRSIIRGVEYHIGVRQFNVFFTEEEASDVFTFRNAFNIEETVYLFGATTIKTEVERSEAICGRETQFYDETVKVKHEVETAALPYNEAKWFNEMLTSKYVTHQLEDGSYKRIVISDITSEVTDSSKELIRLKFSWKYADGSEWI